MSRGRKYYKLENYLIQSEDSVLTLSFSEIEKILGFALPPSAYEHPAPWSNSNSHSIALAWLNAGYNAEQLSLTRQTIVFKRVDTKPTKIEKHQIRKNVSLMTADTAVKLILDYFNETVKDPHGRYMSWRHCYKAFSENRNVTDEHIIDYLSLQLAFYLASWGMYRGSSFLLQKDYKVHIPVVTIIQEQKYNSLYSISAEDLCKEHNLELLNDIAARIRGCYAKEQPSVDRTANNATDTLVTKILLGTLGCIPAFDRYYKNSVKKNHISKGIFNKYSVRSVAEFYCDNLDIFEKLRCEISKCGIEYPPMKLMDMCFWQDAYIDDLKNKHHLDVAFETEE